MKTPFLWVLLLCAGFPLFAQTVDPASSVYLAPVSGIGKTPDDNAFFTDRLAFELMARKYYIAENPVDADYTLTGTLAPWRESPAAQTLHTFRLSLSDTKSGQLVAEQTLVYSSGGEELNKLISVQISAIFPNTPVQQKNTGGWRDKTWYVGAAAFWSPRIYDASSSGAGLLVNFGGGISAALRFIDFMSLETGIETSPDWIAVSGDNDTYWNMGMAIPLSVKCIIKPGTYFLVEPYAGINLNIPLHGPAKPPLFSWRAGLQCGIKAGQGVLFAESRFSMDIGNSTLGAKWKTVEYQRYSIDAGIGYKIGIR